MGVLGNIRETVEFNKSLIFKCFEDVLMSLETKEKQLNAVQNSSVGSSKELNFLRGSTEEPQDQYGIQEEMLKYFQLTRDMFRDLESKKIEMGLVLEDLKVREEKLNQQEKLIEGLLEKIVSENMQAGLDERFAEISLKEKNVKEKLERCRLENELREKIMASREEELVAKEKELEVTREKDLASFLAREKQIEGREMALNTRKEELLGQEKKLEANKKHFLASFVAEEKEHEAREKVLDSRKDKLVAREIQLELRERVLDLKPHEESGGLVEPGCPNDEEIAGYEFKKSIPVNGDYGEGSQPKRKREPRSSPERKRESPGKCHVEREEITKPSNDFQIIAGNTFLEPNPGTSSYLSPQIRKRHFPTFYNFEQYRLKCLPSETWACYDKVDSMPRKYVRIWQKRFCRLKVGILTFNLKDQDINWTETDLPAGCGRFLTEGSAVLMDHDVYVFSHRMVCEYCPSGGYWIYPRKGEIWALFVDWSTGRSSDSGSSKQYRYEIVEVLSNLLEDKSLRVGHLEKIKKHSSLWRRTKNSSFFIWPSQLFRFSHRIPSFQLDGTEKENIPKESFELDPAALPTDLC